MKELLIFGAFGGIQFLAHKSHQMSQHQLLYKITHKPWLVWIIHPSVAHTIQDYVIHVVIYSGKIISGH